MRAILSGIWWLIMTAMFIVAGGAILVGAWSFIAGDNVTGALCIGILIGLGLFSELVKPGRGPWPL